MAFKNFKTVLNSFKANLKSAVFTTREYQSVAFNGSHPMRSIIVIIYFMYSYYILLSFYEVEC